VERAGKAEEGSAVDVEGKAASMVARVTAAVRAASAPKPLLKLVPNPPLVV
jgi:hypothetical protein